MCVEKRYSIIWIILWIPLWIYLNSMNYYLYLSMIERLNNTVYGNWELERKLKLRNSTQQLCVNKELQKQSDCQQCTEIDGSEIKAV